MTAQLSRVRLEAAIGALKFLAEKPRPIYGESLYNTAHLYQIVAELELMLSAPAPKDDENSLNTYDRFVEGWNACRTTLIKAGSVTATPLPHGWKLVPIEPTEEMLRAAWVNHAIHHPSCYRTMVLEAPTPEEYNAKA